LATSSISSNWSTRPSSDSNISLRRYASTAQLRTACEIANRRMFALVQTDLKVSEVCACTHGGWHRYSRGTWCFPRLM
jgi:hypothetical protein